MKIFLPKPNGIRTPDYTLKSIAAQSVACFARERGSEGTGDHEGQRVNLNDIFRDCKTWLGDEFFIVMDFDGKFLEHNTVSLMIDEMNRNKRLGALSLRKVNGNHPNPCHTDIGCTMYRRVVAEKIFLEQTAGCLCPQVHAQILDQKYEHYYLGEKRRFITAKEIYYDA